MRGCRHTRQVLLRYDEAGWTRYAKLNTSVLYRSTAAENLLADASVPVDGPFVASLVSAAR